MLLEYGFCSKLLLWLVEQFNLESTVLHGAETASARSLTLGKKVTKVHLNAGTTGKRRMHLFPLNPKPRGILTTKNVGRLKR